MYWSQPLDCVLIQWFCSSAFPSKIPFQVSQIQISFNLTSESSCRRRNQLPTGSTSGVCYANWKDKRSFFCVRHLSFYCFISCSSYSRSSHYFSLECHFWVRDYELIGFPDGCSID